MGQGPKNSRPTDPDPWWCLGQRGRVQVTAIDEDLLLVSVAAREPRLPGLSPAEREVSLLALQGLPNLEIAKIRGASPRTIANQLATVYRKLGAKGRRELRARASASQSRPDRPVVRPSPSSNI